MINLFLDTEFTGFELITQEIISLGLVSEDGKHEFYVENTDHHETFRSKFVQDVVVPHLEPEKYGMGYDACCMALATFLNRLPSTHINIVYDYVGDRDLIMPMINQVRSHIPSYISFQLFQHAVVTTLHERGVHSVSKVDDAMRELMLGGESYYAIDPRQHHALVDAKANRHAFIRGIEAGMK